MSNRQMDSTDLQLIALLRQDARTTVATLAAKLGVSRGTVTNRYPGLTPENPLDLSAGQSRAQIPTGAYYRDPQGNIRQNQNGDAGNPIRRPAGGAKAQPKAAPASGKGWKIISVE